MPRFSVPSLVRARMEATSEFINKWDNTCFSLFLKPVYCVYKYILCIMYYIYIENGCRCFLLAVVGCLF